MTERYCEALLFAGNQIDPPEFCDNLANDDTEFCDAHSADQQDYEDHMHERMENDRKYGDDL